MAAKRNHQPKNHIFIKEKHSPEQRLVLRLAAIVALVMLVVAVFWFDRDGLKDQIDGHMSFTDVLYFTAVTITTVGYGDIVPVSERARLIDAIFVTPLRLIIWLMFLGTAYELMIQRWLEKLRMQRLHKSLTDHVIICGFGHSGQTAAKEVAQSSSASVVIIDHNAEHLKRAAELGYIGLLGDATAETTLRDAGVDRAKAVLICLGRDDAAVLAILTLRNISKHVRIVAAAREGENIPLMRQAGADSIVAPSLVSGYLMADCVQSTLVSDYIHDLMNSAGRVRLIERPPKPQELGMLLRDICPDMAVRIHRGDTHIGFWEGERSRIQAQDRLIVIEPNA